MLLLCQHKELRAGSQSQHCAVLVHTWPWSCLGLLAQDWDSSLSISTIRDLHSGQGRQRKAFAVVVILPGGLETPWGQDGRNEMCCLKGTHPSHQKRWAEETEAVLQPRRWNLFCAIQESLEWALWLAPGKSGCVTSYAFAQHRSVGNSLSLKRAFSPQLRFLAQMLQSGHCCKRTEPEFQLSLPLPCCGVFCSITACSSTALQLCPCCSHRMAHAARGCGTPSESGKTTTNKRDLLTTNPSGFSQFPDLNYKLPGSNLVSTVGKEESKEIASGNGLRKLQNLK